MATIEENLTLLKNTKSSIKQSIINKGVEVSDTDSFASYANKIDEIPTGGSLQEKSVSITENGQSSVTPDVGFDGLSKVDISVSIANPPTTYDISLPYVSLAGYRGGNLPSEVIGWENLTDGGHKCMYTSLTTYRGDLTLNLPNLINGNGLFYNGLTNYSNFSGNLDKLENGGGMTAYDGMFAESKILSFNSNLPSLIDGNHMFYYCSGLSNWNTELPALQKGVNMFEKCNNIKSWAIDLPLLSSGGYMFSECIFLSTFSGNLPSLTNGEYMFNGCEYLSEWNVELPKLNRGVNMFRGCEKLINWNTNMPLLKDGDHMFADCDNLTTFEGDLSSLTNGYYMFYYCNKLQTFTSNLSSLTSAQSMFYYYSNIALENITLTGTLNCNNFDLSKCTNLTVDSLVNVISVLVDLTGQSSKTLKLGSTNLAKLSEEQKAVATNKNWVLS